LRQPVGSAESQQSEVNDGDTFVLIGKNGEQFGRAAEQAGGGAEAASVDTMTRLFVMEAEVDEAAGELDEGLVESVLWAGGFEPDVFEHVVGFVILGGVEKTEILHVGRSPTTLSGRIQSGEAGGDFFVFAHYCGKKANAGGL
jgi:hypothetical protein